MLIDSWPASAKAWERARRSLAGGVSTGMRATMKPHPLFFRGGMGPSLTDFDGNTYLDHVLGWGPVILGHGHPGLSDAVAGRLAQGATFGAGHELEYEAAERVVAAIPGAERVLWSNTGSEAAQIALRVARAATGRQRFIKMLGHYHGWSDTFLLGYRPDLDGQMGLGSKGQRASALDDAVLVPFGDLDAADAALSRPRSDVAALFVEPVLCNSGVISPPDGYLAGLRRLCDATGTVLVFDEVITGFRIAYGGAAERYGVEPDLAILAKAIAGGYPLSAVAGKASLLDQVASGVVHSGTYNGNPVVLAAAVATLDELRRGGIYQELEFRGQELAHGMRSAATRHELVCAVNQVGPIVQCAFAVPSVDGFEDFIRADQGFYDQVTVQMLRRGVFALPGGRWYISTAHRSADIEAAIDIFDDALSEVLSHGSRPTSAGSTQLATPIRCGSIHRDECNDLSYRAIVEGY